jgi:hypothetical protein
MPFRLGIVPTMESEHWMPVSKAMPPAGVPVEVRWEMGDSRSVILGSMTARDVGTDEWIWINLTTKAPLPYGWRAVEWRPSPVLPPSTQQQQTDTAIPKSA